MVRWGASMVPRAPAPSLQIAFAAALLLATGCIDLGGLAGGRRPLEETVVFGTSGPPVLLLDIRGAIIDADEPGFLGTGPESTVARVREQLARAERSGVRGVLLRIDSPGGSASASEMIYRNLLAFKARTRVPVVAQMMGTAASGGYYVAMAADEIQAYPTTVTGSIGVIMAGLNFAGLMEKLGIENQTFTGGAFKDAGSPLRDMRAEERAYIQAITDALHARFKEVVAAGRPGLTPERVSELADGRVYVAQQALENGLIDRIGTIEEAVARVEALAGVSSSRVVSYHRPNEYRDNLYTRAAPGPVLQLDLRPLLGPSPGFHYLWLPRTN
ncbi:MAG: signal peptide peptidase SppA [Myxococcota bacterium]